MNDKTSGHLREFVREPAAKPAAMEVETGLPTPLAEYSPFSRPANKALYSIHFISPNEEMRSFQYAHLDSDSTYAAGRIALRFVGLQPVTVMIEGRGLQQLYDYIHQHRAAWVKQAARDFAPDGVAIVTKISIVELSADMLSG